MHCRGVATVMALVAAAGRDTAISVIDALQEVLLGIHLAIRLSIDYGDLPGWAASQVHTTIEPNNALLKAKAHDPGPCADCPLMVLQIAWCCCC